MLIWLPSELDFIWNQRLQRVDPWPVVLLLHVEQDVAPDLLLVVVLLGLFLLSRTMSRGLCSIVEQIPIIINLRLFSAAPLKVHVLSNDICVNVKTLPCVCVFFFCQTLLCFGCWVICLYDWSLLLSDGWLCYNELVDLVCLVVFCFSIKFVCTWVCVLL